MSVTIDHAALERHGLTSEEQLAVFAYMQRSMAVRAYEVKQHIAVRAGEATWRRRGGGWREGHGNIIDRSRERRGRASRARVGKASVVVMTWDRGIVLTRMSC
jgi:hypothetical protein